MEITNTTQSSAAYLTDPAVREINSELDRDAFLQLLVLQMQNQDPLEPVSNNEMIAQLAQFSSLEQMESMNDEMGFMSGNIDQLNFISSQGLLGKHVRGVNSDDELVQGLVEAVTLSDSMVVLSVDGEIIQMADVLSVSIDAFGEA